MKLPKAVVPLLKDAASQFSNHTCNDYFLADTKENRKFLVDLYKWMDEDEFSIEDAVYGDRLACTDWMVFEYIAHLVETASE